MARTAEHQMEIPAMRFPRLTACFYSCMARLVMSLQWSRYPYKDKDFLKDRPVYLCLKTPLVCDIVNYMILEAFDFWGGIINYIFLFFSCNYPVCALRKVGQNSRLCPNISSQHTKMFRKDLSSICMYVCMYEYRMFVKKNNSHTHTHTRSY